jgi:hypothetical protein
MSNPPHDPNDPVHISWSHPHKRLFRMVPASALGAGVVAFQDNIRNILFINGDVYPTLDNVQRSQVYKTYTTLVLS